MRTNESIFSPFSPLHPQSQPDRRLKQKGFKKQFSFFPALVYLGCLPLTADDHTVPTAPPNDLPTVVESIKAKQSQLRDLNKRKFNGSWNSRELNDQEDRIKEGIYIEIRDARHLWIPKFREKHNFRLGRTPTTWDLILLHQIFASQDVYEDSSGRGTFSGEYWVEANISLFEKLAQDDIFVEGEQFNGIYLGRVCLAPSKNLNVLNWNAAEHSYRHSLQYSTNLRIKKAIANVPSVSIDFVAGTVSATRNGAEIYSGRATARTSSGGTVTTSPIGSFNRVNVNTGQVVQSGIKMSTGPGAQVSIRGGKYYDADDVRKVAELDAKFKLGTPFAPKIRQTEEMKVLFSAFLAIVQHENIIMPFSKSDRKRLDELNERLKKIDSYLGSLAGVSEADRAGARAREKKAAELEDHWRRTRRFYDDVSETFALPTFLLGEPLL